MISWAGASRCSRGLGADARQPAAQVKLNAIAASTGQALFAVNDSDGEWVIGSAFKSAMACSMTAPSRWLFSVGRVSTGCR